VSGSCEGYFLRVRALGLGSTQSRTERNHQTKPICHGYLRHIGRTLEPGWPLPSRLLPFARIYHLFYDSKSSGTSYSATKTSYKNHSQFSHYIIFGSQLPGTVLLTA
jgi:hypothetical protein